MISIVDRPEISEAVAAYSDYIAGQTLASSLELVQEADDATELDFEDYIVKLKITKA